MSLLCQTWQRFPTSLCIFCLCLMSNFVCLIRVLFLILLCYHGTGTKCRGSWAIHACAGENGTRSKPRVTLRSINRISNVAPASSELDKQLKIRKASFIGGNGKRSEGSAGARAPPALAEQQEPGDRLKRLFQRYIESSAEEPQNDQTEETYGQQALLGPENMLSSLDDGSKEYDYDRLRSLWRTACCVTRPGAVYYCLWCFWPRGCKDEEENEEDKDGDLDMQPLAVPKIISLSNRKHYSILTAFFPRTFIRLSLVRLYIR
ncbi:hypothetical protein CAPTEDRAFT_215458 [Capitella teleta]|uniref:Uncharacterized protein n=1 Tax=Capitella teleta TaxID=283909 RepID=R7U7K5_CAPTE|nr:hypothetical protein CAPTEDRAFT_215458 [Capitella teleta]|eukprot:ELT99125.1 hypothetical protein CAPTEDRAFT_215458 [Capitella teleta]